MAEREINESDIPIILSKSYFTDLKILKEHVIKKAGLKGYNLFNIVVGETKLFLIRFDRIIGPVIASSKNDVTIAERINQNLEKNNKIKLTDVEKDEFLRFGNQELINIAQKVLDFDLLSEGSDYEFVLKNNKTKKTFYFRSFNVKNKNARGGYESFLLVFATDKFEKEKFDKAAEIMKGLLNSYFKLFERGYGFDQINEYLIKPVITFFNSQKYTPNEEGIIKRFYGIKS